MLDDVIRFLICPYCGQAVRRDGMAVRCPVGHAFDVARQGYVSLLPPGGKAHAGDTAAMVAARADFLAAGHFEHLAAELAESAAGAASGAGREGCIADVGAGTGYYLAAALARLPGRVGLALDASRFALRRAARAHERIGAVGCDVWRALPVAGGAAAVVLNVFAPRNGAELHRIVAPGGRLLVVTPTALHLKELIAPLGLLTVDRRKEERLSRTLDPFFARTTSRDISRTMVLGHQDISAAVTMGPSAWQSDPAVRQARIRDLPDPLAVTLSVTLSSYARSDR